MASKIRLFEKDAAGMLREVERDRRGERPVSRVVLEIEVLWTDEEMAERAQDEAAHQARKAETRAAEAALQERRKAIAGRLGLSMTELEELLK